MPKSDPFQRIAVAANPQIEEALREAERVTTFLLGCEVETSYAYLDDLGLRQRVTDGEFDLLIALGGDGTMLRAGHLVAPAGVPILGINLGRFGFLIEVQRGQWESSLTRLLDGDYWVESRMMVRAEQWRAGECLGSWDALNEAVVSHGEVKRPVHLHASVDGRDLTTYVADGLIAATPTGSTAYALAAGGPILPPSLRNILLVPVAPHLTLDRAIVLAEGSSVSIRVETPHPAVLSVDGQLPVHLDDGDRVEVWASKHNVDFIRLQDPSYFYRNIIACMNQNPSIGIKR
jgi:NAD+ kinase